MTVSHYNPATNEASIQFIGQPTRREREDVATDCGRFILRQSFGGDVKTTIRVPGEPLRIMFLRRPSAIASVINAS